MVVAAFALLLACTSLAGFADASAPEPWRAAESQPIAAIRVALPAAEGPAAAEGLSAPSPTRSGGLPATLRSWPQTVRSIVATPVFSDLNGDGAQEVIAADDRYVYAYDLTGALLPGWPRDTGGTQQHAAVGDLDGDGEPEIAITSNLPLPKLWVFDAAGNPEPGWPVLIPFTQLANLTCPVLIDLDGDDALDVGVAGENGVFFYHADGTPLSGWPYLWSVPINNPQWSAPAVGDLEGDGDLEVAVGNACYPNWGVHVIRADGTPMPGWPKVVKPIFSSPALADLDGDGDLEVIAQEGDPGAQGNRLWVWHHDGTIMAGWPRTIAAEGFSSRSNPAVADVEGDGPLEIVTVTGDGNLHVFRPDGTELPGYPRSTGGSQPIASVSVVDVEGDGPQEIFLTYWSANQQFVSGWHIAGDVVAGFPKLLISPSDLNSHCSTHFSDADGDGSWELATAGASFSQGRVWVFDLGGSLAATTPRADWPKIRRDVENRGCFCGLDPAAVAEGPNVFGGLSVYPNPCGREGLITLRLPANGTGAGDVAGSIAVFDAAGRMVGRLSSSVARRPVALKELFGGVEAASGIYFLRWNAEDRSARAGVSPATRVLVIGE